MKNHLKMWIGFPIGVTVLVLTYILIGAIDGLEAYNTEINKLAEYKYLLGQAVFSGMSYVIVAYMIGVVKEVGRKARIEEKQSILEVVGYLAAATVLFVACFAISRVIGRRGTLQGYVGEVFYRITVLGLTVTIIGMLLRGEIESTRINKALKKRQEENKE